MVRLAVRVQPRAKANALAGWQEGALKVRLTAPPVEGKANKALVNYLAEVLGVARSALTIVSGQNARAKVLAIEGLDEAELYRRLGKP